MAFFPTFESKFTRTPNVFFDEILRDPKANLNQVRLVGYLIRKTIGYNQEAKWAGISRTDLIDKAGIPNSRIKGAIEGCKKNGWILIYEKGAGAKKKRYFFLNDERNQRIVEALNQNLFEISDLEYLNLAGIDKLLEKYEIRVDTAETGGEQKFPTTETGGVTTTETGGVTTTETGGVTTTQSQEPQAIVEPLNTSFKDNIKIQQHTEKKDVVVVVQNQIKKNIGKSISKRIAKNLITTLEEHEKGIDEGISLLTDVITKYKKAFNHPLPMKSACSLLSSLLENECDFDEVLKGTISYFKQRGETIVNPVGALKNAMENGLTLVELPKRKEEPRRYPSVEETKRYLQTLGGDL